MPEVVTPIFFPSRYTSQCSRAIPRPVISMPTRRRAGCSFPASAALPMKWHKFLIYFALWAGAILNGISGISTLFSCFGGEYAAVYDAYPALLGLDIFSSLCLIGIAVFQFITRNALARFSRKAPQMVVWLYASTVILSVLQVVAVWLVSGVGLSYVMTPDMWLILIEGALMTWANQVYYRKRAAMFVN